MILQEAKAFPRVSASTLSRAKVEFPQQLCGRVSLMTVSLRAIGMVCDWTGFSSSLCFNSPSSDIMPFSLHHANRTLMSCTDNRL